MESAQERSDRHAKIASGIGLLLLGIVGMVLFMTQEQPSGYLIIGCAAVGIFGFVYAGAHAK